MAIDGLDDLNARIDALRSGNATRQLLLQVGNTIVARAQQNAPKKTGTLMRSIRVDDVNVEEQTAKVRAGGIGRRGANQYGTYKSGIIGYAAFVEFGTGIYGPRRTPIVPVRRKALRFPRAGAATRLSGNLTSAQQRAGGGYAFAKSVKGRKATPYLIPAVKDVVDKLGLAQTIIDVWNDPR